MVLCSKIKTNCEKEMTAILKFAVLIKGICEQLLKLFIITKIF